MIANVGFLFRRPAISDHSRANPNFSPGRQTGTSRLSPQQEPLRPQSKRMPNGRAPHPNIYHRGQRTHHGSRVASPTSPTNSITSPSHPNHTSQNQSPRIARREAASRPPLHGCARAIRHGERFAMPEEIAVTPGKDGQPDAEQRWMKTHYQRRFRRPIRPSSAQAASARVEGSGIAVET